MEHFWPESNGHPVKYESDAAVSGFPYERDTGLNFAASGAGYSEDDTEYPSGRRGKASRQDPLSHRIIEKRRRDRMNSCLADLSRLIPPQYQRKGRGRIEKTEIIEMAIRHMKFLQHQDCALHEYEYRAGYRACLEQTVKFLNDRHMKEVCTQMVPHLNEHCDEIMDNRKGVITNEYFKGRGVSNNTPAPLAINNNNNNNSHSNNMNGISNGVMSSASLMMMDSVSGSSSRSPPMAPAPAHQHQQAAFHPATPSTTTTTPTTTSEDNNNNSHHHHHLHSTDSNDDELVLAKDLSFRSSQPHQAAVITSTPPSAHNMLPHAVVDYETTSTSTNATTVTIGSQSDNEKPTTFVKMPNLMPQQQQQHQQSKKRHHEIDDIDTDDDHHSLNHNSLSNHQLDHNYKFKNYIQQRFTQDAYFKEDTDEDEHHHHHHHHHIEKIDEIIKKSKKKQQQQQQQVPVSSSSSSTMSLHRKNIRVPIFALHASGSFYIPLQIDYDVLTPFLNGHDLLDSATSQLQAAMLAMHPVNINVCFQASHHVQTITPINGLTNGMRAPGPELFAKPKIELTTNGW